MLIPNMLLLVTEDQLIRSKFSKYVCKISMKNSMHTGCNKIIAPCTLYTKNGIFYFCNRSNC